MAPRCGTPPPRPHLHRGRLPYLPRALLPNLLPLLRVPSPLRHRRHPHRLHHHHLPRRLLPRHHPEKGANRRLPSHLLPLLPAGHLRTPLPHRLRKHRLPLPQPLPRRMLPPPRGPTPHQRRPNRSPGGPRRRRALNIRRVHPSRRALPPRPPLPRIPHHPRAHRLPPHAPRHRRGPRRVPRPRLGIAALPRVLPPQRPQLRVLGIVLGVHARRQAVRVHANPLHHGRHPPPHRRGARHVLRRPENVEKEKLVKETKTNKKTGLFLYASSSLAPSYLYSSACPATLRIPEA
mmetsp:Transcript_11899/g.31449  ORF Transcript_11899/g.31449 Transcript_11899/m.31449 type:complete len:291 (+) Transcript_11899:241-1113(+)